MYFVTTQSPDEFGWEKLDPDLQKHILFKLTDVSFKVKIPLKRHLSSEHKFDTQWPLDAYDPMLYVMQTFEFSRPRTHELGLGCVHFKYSQRAMAEQRPAEEHDNYVTQQYVDKVVEGMQHEIYWNDISKIRLLRSSYNFCTFEVVRKIDGRDVTIKLDGRPSDNDTGIVKPKFKVEWNGWHYNHYAHMFIDKLKLNFASQNEAEYNFAPQAVDEYSVCD